MTSVLPLHPPRHQHTAPHPPRHHDLAATLAATVGDTSCQVTAPFTDSTVRGFWAKLEGFNPGGIKDRPAMHMVERARPGDLRPEARIIESAAALWVWVWRWPAWCTSTRSPWSPTRVWSRSWPGCCRPTAFRSNRSPNLTPLADGSRPRCDRVAQLLAEIPTPGTPTSTTTPTTSGPTTRPGPGTAGQPDGSTYSCVRSAPADLRRRGRVLREDNPGMELIGWTPSGPPFSGSPPDPGLMRGLGSSIYPSNVDYPAFNEVTGSPRRSRLGVPGAFHPLRQRQVERRGGRSGGRVGRTHLPAQEHDRGDLFPDGPQRYFDTVFNDDYLPSPSPARQLAPTAPQTISDPAQTVVDSWTRCTRVLNPAEEQS